MCSFSQSFDDMNDSVSLEIFNTLSLSDMEAKSLDSKFYKRSLKKGELLLTAGETVRHQYFISEGCLRTFYIDDSGKEHTMQFAVKDWWISDYTAFFTSSTAIMNIDCIQDAIIYKVSKDDMEALFLEIPRLETFFRKKMEGAFSSFHKRILGSLSQSAGERYSIFIRTYPNIEQSVKNYHIASYLGITTESLSRIRKKIAQG